MVENCNHLYSKGIGEPRPRLCINCGDPEICRACEGDGEIHMCGDPHLPTLEEVIVEFLEGNSIEDKVVHTRNKIDRKLQVPLSEVLGDFHEFMSTRRIKG